MYKFEDLLKLEKNCDLDIGYCKYIIDIEDTEKNTRERILECDCKYYYHLMQHGKVLECFEILDWWQSFDNRICFVYTPDNLHCYEMEAFIDRNSISREYAKLKDNQIVNGTKAQIDDDIITFIDNEHLDINGRIIKIINDGEYVYKLQKSQIRAINGARGLFAFLEQTAEESKHRYASWAYNFKLICNKYKED